MDFSGIGVLIISFVISYLLNKKDKNKSIKPSANFYTDNTENSYVNNIQGDKVSINQSIINHVKETIQEKEADQVKKETVDLPEFEKAKRTITNQKTRIRTYINAILASARAQNLDSKLEIRYLLTLIGKKRGLSLLVLLNQRLDRRIEFA